MSLGKLMLNYFPNARMMFHLKERDLYIPLSPCPVLFQDGQSRTVRQFQFTDWPEQGVPKSGEGFIDFIGQVHKTKEQFGQDGPISVHCR